MAAYTWYLTNASASVGSDLSASDPGAEAYRSPVTGWIVSTGSTNRSEWYNDVERAANTFSGTSVPDGTLDTTNGDFWVSPTTLTGTFASANWNVYVGVRANTGGDTHSGKAYVRLFRGPNQDGSGATEITGAAQAGSAVTNLLTSATQVSTVTFNPGSFAVTAEYIFIQIAWERTGAAGMTTYDVNARIGGSSSCRVVTSDFTPPTILYWIVQPDATATPSAAQIVAGQDGTGAAALKSGSETYTVAGTYDEATAITGLSASTAYEQCWVAYNGSAYSNVVSGTITTTGAAITIDCSVGNAVAAGVASTISTELLIVCGWGAAIAAGVTATISTAQTISCGLGNAVAAGASCTLALDQAVACAVGDAAAAGTAASITLGSETTISCSVGNAAAAGITATLATDQTIGCSVGNAAAAGTTATISTAQTVACGIGNAVAAGTAATIVTPVTVNASVGNAAAAGTTAALSTDQSIVCSVGNAAAAGVSAAITVDGNITIDCTVGDAVAAGVRALIEAASAAAAAAGKSRRRKRKYQLEVDGEVFDVASPEEAEEVLERVREEAEKTAAVAIERATKAKRRPVRKVIADAKKALQLPQIAVSSPDISAMANQMLGAIRAQYDAALSAIEIAAHMARRDREIEDDDEEVMLLL